MRKLSIVMMAGLVLIAVAAAQSDEIYGVWDYPDVEKEGVTFKETLEFARGSGQSVDEILETVRCTRDDASAEARARSSVEIRDEEYQVLEESSDSESEGDLPCVATIHRGTIGYEISEDGGELQTTNEGQLVTLRRRR
jgi:hypothetical protein